VASNPDLKALALYAVLDRDAGDFLEMLAEETDIEVVRTLYLVLATPNPGTHERDRELNQIGAGIVRDNLLKRGVEPPSIPALTTPPRQGSLF
jgi:hypothetical protein